MVTIGDGRLKARWEFSTLHAGVEIIFLGTEAGKGDDESKVLFCYLHELVLD